MFGYLKIYANELKVKDVRMYKKMYCSLCYGLRQNFGYVYSMILNFESVFLLILLDSIISNNEDNCCHKIFRCPAMPMKRVELDIDKGILEYVSFINYCLVILKLKDNSYDEKKNMNKLILYIFENNKRFIRLKEKYKNLFNEIHYQYECLYAMEKEKMYKFDDMSATMGELLKNIVMFYCTNACGEIEDKILADFCSHLGKWIYLIDAYDDFESDYKKGLFNPLTEFEQETELSALEVGELMSKMMTSKMTETLNYLSINRNKEIIQNIIRYGTSNTLQRIKKKKIEKVKCRRKRYSE